MRAAARWTGQTILCGRGERASSAFPALLLARPLHMQVHTEHPGSPIAQLHLLTQRCHTLDVAAKDSHALLGACRKLLDGRNKNSINECTSMLGWPAKLVAFSQCTEVSTHNIRLLQKCQHWVQAKVYERNAPMPPIGQSHEDLF